MSLLKSKVRLAFFVYLMPAVICWLIFRLVTFILEPSHSIENSLIAFAVYIALIIGSFIVSYIMAIFELSASWEVRFFFTLISCILFLPIILIIAPIAAACIWVSSKFKNSKWGCNITSILGLIAMFSVSLFVRQKGNVKAFRNAKKGIVVFNHRSSADYFITGFIGLFRNWRAMIGANLWNWRIFHWFFNAVGVPIAREKEKADERAKAVNISKEFLSSKGEAILILYPEGTRNRGEGVLSFHNGAFRIACDLSVDIYPIVLLRADMWRKPGKQNTSSFVKKKNISMRSVFQKGIGLVKRIFQEGINPTIVKMHYLDPISPIGKTFEELKIEVHKKMSDFYSLYSQGHI